MDSLVMVADVMADLKEKSDGELADRCGSVCRNIYDRNSLFSGVVIVDDIVAGGESRDQLDTRTLVDGLTGDRGVLFVMIISASPIRSVIRGDSVKEVLS